MVDNTLILRKIAILEEYRWQMDEYTRISTAEYATDWKTQRIVERTLQMMIETCLDIAGHIISDGNFRTPDSYADMFAILAEQQIIDPKDQPAMSNMAKFRNIIVHQYETIDPAIVVGILQKHLDDFDRFKQSILMYLVNRKSDRPT